MLTLIIKADELYDEEKNEFYSVGGFELQLEHSLASVSKWESIVQRPFLASDEKSAQEIRLYVECMIISPDCPPNVVQMMSSENYVTINAYIDSPASATTFGSMPETKGRGETITSELIYYWMVAFNIPFECEKWHLNRLFSLIRICNIKNQPPKKMSKNELAQNYRKLNEERKAQLGTRG